MADGQDDSNNTQTNTSPDPAPIPDVKHDAEAIAANRRQADSLIIEIQGQNSVALTKVGEIEQVRLAAEKAKAEIDGQLTAMQTAVAALIPQLEAARAAGSELTALNASIQAANAASAETAKQASSSVESAKQLASTASEIIGRLEAIRDNAIQIQTTIAERNAWIESGREHVAKFLQDVEKSLDESRRSAASAESFLQSAKTTSESTSDLRNAVQATKERIDIDASAVFAARTASENHAAITKRISEIAASTEDRVAKYEAALGQMQEINRQQSARIDEILAGATDGSLGGAYRKRGELFKLPEKRWQRVFIASLIGLLAVAGWQAYALGNLAKPPEWEELARMMLLKLPFLVPLIWLAIHAARQASFAKRMEEEYAFKATTSFSFEGYRRQMAEVGKQLDANSPLAHLCNNTLKTISAHPGKVYDKQRMDPTPGTAAAEFVGPVVEGVSKALAAKLPDLKL